MKVLAVSALLCAMMALTAAAAAPEIEPEEATVAAPVGEPEEAPVAAEKEPEDEEAPAEPEDEEAPAEELEVEKRTSCTYGWTWIGRRAFLYVSKPLTWAEAEKNCVSLGGHLASVHSQWEYNQIRNLITKQTRGNPTTWVGGSDCKKEGVWRWSDGSKFNFRKWCCGEPNNGGGTNQDCLQINFTGHRCWDDLWCNHRRPSLCVRKW